MKASILKVLIGVAVALPIHALGAEQDAPYDFGVKEESSSETSVTLTWTVPPAVSGDGKCDKYDLRISTEEMTVETFERFPETIDDEPEPGEEGSKQTYLLAGLEPGVTYWAGLRVYDDKGWSLPTIISFETLTDRDPPSTITLAASPAAGGGIALAFLAPCEDSQDPGSGAASAYELKYSTSSFTAGDWADPGLIVVAVPGLPLAPGTAEEVVLPGLGAGTYHFGIRSRDERSNPSAVSNIAVGVVVNPAPPPASNADDGDGGGCFGAASGAPWLLPLLLAALTAIRRR